MGEIVMKKLHRLFSFVVSLLMTINVFAQSTEMTPYETKRDQLVNEGLQNKLSRMPEDAQGKLQETLERIVNEGSGGLICIIL